MTLQVSTFATQSPPIPDLKRTLADVSYGPPADSRASGQGALKWVRFCFGYAERTFGKGARWTP
ncbi:MAG: hypothetical protein WA858_29630, partial [Xanthobacteraceae bacterium]